MSKTITFEFNGVIAQMDKEAPVENALPALRRAIKEYDQVYVYDHDLTNYYIKKWFQRYDPALLDEIHCSTLFPETTEFVRYFNENTIVHSKEVNLADFFNDRI